MNMYSSLEKKLSKSIGYRTDLQMSDAHKIDKHTAHFMLSFTGDSPTNDDIADFFIRKFNAKVTPLIATSRVNTKEKVVTVVASMLNISREFKDHSKMTPVIAGSTYLDVPLQEVWEVKERSGQKVLVRKMKEDIMAMVEARKKVMFDQSSSRHKTFASLAQNDGLLKYLAILEKGDVVKAYVDGMIVEDCVVLAVTSTEAKLKISADEDKDLVIPRQAVIEVQKRNAVSEKDMQKKLEEYFTDAYGDPGYAKELVHGK